MALRTQTESSFALYTSNQRKYMNGTVKTLNPKGYGFISRPGEEKDLFFHSSELNGVMFDELREGDAVTFEVTNGDKGPAATNVARA